MRDAISELDPSCVCVTYRSPVEALENLKAGLYDIPDVIFTDFNMPALPGDEVVRQLRLYDKFKDTVIVVLSTSMPKSKESIFYNQGASYVFKKPSKFNDYRDLLITIFKSSYSWINH